MINHNLLFADTLKDFYNRKPERMSDLERKIGESQAYYKFNYNGNWYEVRINHTLPMQDRLKVHTKRSNYNYYTQRVYDTLPSRLLSALQDDYSEYKTNKNRLEILNLFDLEEPLTK